MKFKDDTGWLILIALLVITGLAMIGHLVCQLPPPEGSGL